MRKMHAWLHNKIEENTIRHFMLEKWIPSIVSFIIGSAIISFVIPQLQAGFEVEQLYKRRKLELAEEISKDFSAYVIEWDRVVGIGNYEEKLPRTTSLDKESIKRKERYVKKRDEARNKLHASLVLSRLYYSEKMLKAISDFEKWEDTQRERDKNIDKLSTEDWIRHFNGWITQLKAQREILIMQLKVEVVEK